LLVDVGIVAQGSVGRSDGHIDKPAGNTVAFNYEVLADIGRIAEQALLRVLAGIDDQVAIRVHFARQKRRPEEVDVEIQQCYRAVDREVLREGEEAEIDLEEREQ